MTLLVLAWLGDVSSRRFGTLGLTNMTIPCGVALVLFGILPSVTLSMIAIAVSSDRPRSWSLLASYILAVAAFQVSGGLVLEAARRAGALSGGATALAGWAMVAIAVAEIANFVVLALGQRTIGRPFKTTVRTSLLPGLPYVILAVAGVGLTVYCYEQFGYVALPASALLAATLGWTLDLLWRGERRLVALDESIRERDELSQQLVSAEERARRSLAADLHDDALQLVAVVRHDVSDGALDHLPEQLEAIDASLRALLVRLDAFGTRTTVPVAFEELVATIGGRSGLRIECSVDPALADIVDADLVSCARELLLNVEKHAQATHVWITVEGTRLSVADDGRGADIKIASALERGHVGLALVAHRVQSRGGDLSFEPRPGGGLRAIATLLRH